MSGTITPADRAGTPPRPNSREMARAVTSMGLTRKKIMPPAQLSNQTSKSKEKPKNALPLRHLAEFRPENTLKIRE